MAPSGDKKHRLWRMSRSLIGQIKTGRNFLAKTTHLGENVLGELQRILMWQEMSLWGRKAGVRLGQALKFWTFIIYML